MLSRRLASTALALFLTACATSPNTLAQDLAWERVKKCEHVTNNIILQRVELDGTVWVEMRNGTAGYQEWQACMHKAALEQAAAGPTAPAPPTSPASRRRRRPPRRHRRPLHCPARWPRRPGRRETSGPIGGKADPDRARTSCPSIEKRPLTASNTSSSSRGRARCTIA